MTIGNVLLKFKSKTQIFPLKSPTWTLKSFLKWSLKCQLTANKFGRFNENDNDVTPVSVWYCRSGNLKKRIRSKIQKKITSGFFVFQQQTRPEWSHWLRDLSNQTYLHDRHCIELVHNQRLINSKIILLFLRDFPTIYFTWFFSLKARQETWRFSVK